MFGFMIGTACLIGLFVVLRRGRRWHGRWHESAMGCSGGGRNRWLLHGILERLDTTPAQERVIKDAVDEFVEQARTLKKELRDSRDDFAKAVRGDSFNEEVFGEIFSRHDDAITHLRKELVGLFARVHEVLDDRQRRRLGDLIESGPGFGFRHGPYRSHWA